MARPFDIKGAFEWARITEARQVTLDHVLMATLFQGARRDLADARTARHAIAHLLDRVLSVLSSKRYTLPSDTARDYLREEAAKGGQPEGVRFAPRPEEWGDPLSEEFREFVARHGKIAQERGEEFTTVYEVLADVVTYPQFRALLEQVGYTAEELRERFTRLPLQDQAADAGPPLRTIKDDVFHLLKPRTMAQRMPIPYGFAVREATRVPLLLDHDTLSLGHLFLAAVQQLQQVGPTDILGQDFPLDELANAVQSALTGGKWPPSYLWWPDPVTGERRLRGTMLFLEVRISPEVERLLLTHAENATERGHQFTTVFEVMDDALRYSHVQTLVRKAGYDPQELRQQLKLLLHQG